jgi:hypothetical protein
MPGEIVEQPQVELMPTDPTANTELTQQPVRSALHRTPPLRVLPVLGGELQHITNINHSLLSPK